jgi:F-type H+-transporting ATPase subunit delta
VSAEGAVARRYAKALLDLAEERNQVDAVGGDLEAVAAALENSRELRAVFQNPTIPGSARVAVVEAIGARLGLQQVTKNALKLLAERGRMAVVRGVARAYAQLQEDRGGALRAEVTTAIEMPDAYFAELERALAQVTGRRVRLDRRVDPTILAGVVTKVGDRVFDGSLKNRLADLREQMLAD